MVAKTSQPEAEVTKMNVYQKLSKVRVDLHSTPLQKSGNNAYAGYKYFELGDFLPTAIKLFDHYGLLAIDDFSSRETATLTIIDMDAPADRIVFSSPIAEANLKGCHPVQILGAQQTYIRRYLYTMALEIVEHDALDAATGKMEVDKPAIKLDQQILDRVDQSATVEELNEAWKSIDVGMRHAYKATFSQAKERMTNAPL